MIICSNCGVGIDDGFTICPLCGRDPLNSQEQEVISDNFPSDIIFLHKKEVRKHLWELSAIISFSGIAVCTIVDLLVNKSLHWSLFTDVSISATWIILTLSLFVFRKTPVFILLVMMTVLSDLFFTNIISHGKNWFLPVGLPVTLDLFASVAIIYIFIRSVRLKGLNIIAAGLIALSAFCIILEVILDNFTAGHVDLRWSLIVAVSILPVALVLIHYHYRLRRGNRLDSIFHV